MKNRCNRFSSLVIFGLLLLSATAPLHALDFGDWGRKAEITFSGYKGTETLTNFPALVVLGPGTITGFAYDDSPDGGADLRFSDSTGLVELPYEIEQWNPAGKSYVWVRIPELVDANTSIWAYWNRAGQTAPDYTTNGAGTVVIRPRSAPANAGTLIVKNDTVSYNGVTPLPPDVPTTTGELGAVTLRIEKHGRVSLNADLRVGDLYLVEGSASPAMLDLNGHTLKVDTYRHPDWGDEAWVVYDGGQIVWRGGTVLIVR